MNTLSKALTSRVLIDPTVYVRLRQQWSVMMCASPQPPLGPEHHLLYLALIGKDWRKAFTPVTNTRKLANGGFRNWGLMHAIRRVRFDLPRGLLAPFGGIVTPPMLENVRLVLANKKVWGSKPEEYVNGNFPFEAYALPAEWEADDIHA